MKLIVCATHHGWRTLPETVVPALVAANKAQPIEGLSGTDVRPAVSFAPFTDADRQMIANPPIAEGVATAVEAPVQATKVDVAAVTATEVAVPSIDDVATSLTVDEVEAEPEPAAEPQSTARRRRKE